MTGGTWREQYDRTRRFYSRFAKIADSGRVHDRDSDNYRDDVLTFFIHCYHLKDWLKNDPSSGVTGSDAEACVNSSLYLRLCGDLANGTKHMEHRGRAASDTAMGARFEVEVNDTMGGAIPKPTRISVQYEVMSSGARHDAFDVATRAMEAWDAFLTTRGLLP